MLFTDSLASLLIAALSRRRLSVIRRAVLRYAPPLLGAVLLGSTTLILASLVAAGALDRLVVSWLVLAAVGCTAHTIVIVLFSVFTVQPALGFARIRATLIAALLPGLALQGVAAAFAGVAGMVMVFVAVNLALAWWFVAVMRRSVLDADALVTSQRLSAGSVHRPLPSTVERCVS